MWYFALMPPNVLGDSPPRCEMSTPTSFIDAVHTVAAPHNIQNVVTLNHRLVTLLQATHHVYTIARPVCSSEEYFRDAAAVHVTQARASFTFN